MSLRDLRVRKLRLPLSLRAPDPLRLPAIVCSPITGYEPTRLPFPIDQQKWLTRFGWLHTIRTHRIVRQSKGHRTVEPVESDDELVQNILTKQHVCALQRGEILHRNSHKAIP